MSECTIDLRSDTVTRPTPMMRQAMAQADVGDDVLGADPTTNRLEQTVAERLGKEAAIFMPSGTMTNQVAIRVHCRPGDEFFCEQECHIYNYEQGAFAQLSGVVAHTIKTSDGILNVDDVVHRVRPDNDHMVRSRMVCLENTHNRQGGRILSFDAVRRLCQGTHEVGLKTHLDGARLFNAVVGSGIDAETWAHEFDSVSICFSKGLGAPVGSALVGDRDFIKEARRHRKVLGGGMRQCGVIAAGALYAIENHVDRLAEDHENAQRLADHIREASGLRLCFDTIDTNILFFEVDPEIGTALEFVQQMADHGLLMLPEASHTVRALTHLDVNGSQIDRAGEILRRLADNRLGTST